MRSTALVAALLVALVAPAGPVSADDPAAEVERPMLLKTKLKGFKSGVKTTKAGRVHRNRVKVIGGAPRTVEIQYSSDGSTWVTRRSVSTAADGRARITMKVAPDRNRWRVRVLPNATHDAAVSGVKTFAVQADDNYTGLPPAATGTPESAKAFARSYILATYGWGDDQWVALEQLWTRESGWQWNADNPYSDAYGIPQALPGEKMASAGADWKTNPETQIKWGCSYIKGRYGDPKGAWAHFLAKNWY